MGTNTNDASEVFERYAEGITEPEERERFTRYMEAWRAKQKVARPHDESVGELHKRIEVLEAARTADLENEGKLRMENAELRGRLRSVPSAGDAALLSVRANQIECLQKEVDRLHEELENMTKDKDELQAKLDAAESDNSVLRTECTEREKLQAEVDELREELDARTAERDGLQSFLCASIPMPVDLDGVLWTGEEETFIGWDGNEHELGSLSYANGAWKIEDADSHSCFKPEKCLHVSPKSTGRETLADVHASVETPVCEYFGRKAFEFKCKDCPEGDIWECSAKKVHDEIDRAYECGRRDGMDANGTASIGNGTCPDGGAE